MKKSYLFLVIICSMILLSVSRSDVQACSCATGGNLADSYSGTNAVFEGKIISVSKQFAWTLGATGDEAIYEVTRAWKGVTEKYVAVKTGMGGGDCGVTFAIDGKQKMFFSGRASNDTALSVNTCTKIFSQQDVIAAYGPGTTNLHNNWWVLYVPSTWPLLVAVAGMGIVFLSLVWLFRKKNNTLI